MSVGQAPSREEQVRVIRAVDNFLEFLKYVKIQDPVKGEVVWEAWPYLIEMARVFSEPDPTDYNKALHRRLCLLKARQLGLSWGICAYALHHSLRRNKLVLVVSQGEEEAWEMLRKVEFIRTRLPQEWSVRRINDSRTVIELANGSSIRALPSTEKAGSGYAASLVIADEHAKHPFAAANYSTLEPTVNAGAQFISLSSYWPSGDFFKNLYLGAKEHTNGFEAHFLGCMLRPGRDAAWYETTKAAFKGLPGHFLREYPRTEAEALASVEGICAFDMEALGRLGAGARTPMFKETFPLGYLARWQNPIPGRYYCCGTDVTYGLAATDAGVSQILDSQTGAHVASLWGHMPPEDLMVRTVKLCQEYNNAFLGVEENGVGQFGIRTLQDIGYYNVYYRDQEEAYRAGKRPVKMGWHTGQNRPILVAALGAALSGGELVTWDDETIGECRTFIIEGNREEAARGCHDDRVMALAIAWQMRQVGYRGGMGVSGGYGGMVHARSFVKLR